MLKSILKAEYNLQIVDYQCVKTIDTLVFHAKTADQKAYAVKLYRPHNAALVMKLKETAAFLTYLKTQTDLIVQAPPLPHFPLIDWENERRYVVVSEWIEGDVPPVLDADLMEKMGVLMAQLHTAAANFEKKLPILRIDWALIQQVKPKILAKRKVLNFDEKTLSRAFQNLENTYKNHPETPSVFGLIHSDLHRKNLLLNGKTLAPIDFDDLAYGHYLLDIAIVFNEITIFEKQDFSPQKQAQNAQFLKKYFLTGYKKYRRLPDNFETQIIDFQRVANAIYLNWILNEGNEDLLLDKALIRFAQMSLRHLLA